MGQTRRPKAYLEWKSDGSGGGLVRHIDGHVLSIEVKPEKTHRPGQIFWVYRLLIDGEEVGTCAGIQASARVKLMKIFRERQAGNA